MKVAAWFNGVLSTVMFLLVYYLLKGFWNHDKDLIISCALMFVLLFVFWFATAAESFEKPF